MLANPRINEEKKLCARDGCGVWFGRTRYSSGVLEPMRKYRKREMCSVRCVGLSLVRRGERKPCKCGCARLPRVRGSKFFSVDCYREFQEKKRRKKERLRWCIHCGSPLKAHRYATSPTDRSGGYTINKLWCDVECRQLFVDDPVNIGWTDWPLSELQSRARRIAEQQGAMDETYTIAAFAA